MQSEHEEAEDVFFDSLDSFPASPNLTSSEEDYSENLGSEFDVLCHQVWISEPRSICERRVSFLKKMGFRELVLSDSCGSQEIEENSDGFVEHPDLGRLLENNDAVLDPVGCDKERTESNLHCCISDLDRGKKFIVPRFSQENLLITSLREVSSGRMITWEEFEKSLGFSPFLQALMRKDNSMFLENTDGVATKRKKKSKSWWKRLSTRRYFTYFCKCSVPIPGAPIKKAETTKMHHLGKPFKGFAAVSVGQEFQAHEGSVSVMKFSLDGRYLATGGEDCVVRIWQAMEVDISDKYCFGNCIHECVDKVEGKLVLETTCLGSSSIPLAITGKVFRFEETPLHEFYGHTSDILDLSWSVSNCLLSSSKDNTVHMWQVGIGNCLKVFQHKDYVTCVQLNPIDDDYFISGSIDGKVRIWRISDCRVVDWVDVRDIVTAVCYEPDGQGFLVGSITGNCRLYFFSGNNLHLYAELNIQGRKKPSGKRITGFQFSPQDPEKVMITSADARVRIFNGIDLIYKYRGLRKARSQLSASFTPDGRYIVSLADDSHVYIWNYEVSGPRSSARTRSARACQYFFSKDASVAVPWPGMDVTASASRDGKRVSPGEQRSGAGSSPGRGRPDAERFSLGAWLFADCPARVSATWPEEKLSLRTEPADAAGRCWRRHGRAGREVGNGASRSADAWSRVIVTAGHDGAIRSYTTDFLSG